MPNEHIGPSVVTTEVGNGPQREAAEDQGNILGTMESVDPSGRRTSGPGLQPLQSVLPPTILLSARSMSDSLAMSLGLPQLSQPLLPHLTLQGVDLTSPGGGQGGSRRRSSSACGGSGGGAHSLVVTTDMAGHGGRGVGRPM